MTEDTVYLLLRSGFDAICIDRVEGSFPIRTVLLRVGGRRPLGVGPAGLALMACMADAEIAEMLKINREAMADFAIADAARLWRAVEQTRARGYSLTRDWAIAGISGVGVAIPSSRAVHLAISISSISSRLGEERAEEVAALLREEASSLPIDEAFIMGG
jgi:DNA-binding IclR family transcriptional regulator